MARIRTIKPEFYRHEGLQDLEAANPGMYVMLVFSALFGHCDKEGAFLWKPRTLKLDILPFLDFDLSASLVLLREAGLINQYEVGGEQYGYIPTFKEHQRISGKEAQEHAKYPQPTVKPQIKNWEALEVSQGSTGEAPETAGREGKGREEELASPPRYRFEGKTVRLNEKDYLSLKSTYHTIADFDAELKAADAHYTGNPSKDWFHKLGGWLNNSHQQNLTRKASQKQKPRLAGMQTI